MDSSHQIQLCPRNNETFPDKPELDMGVHPYPSTVFLDMGLLMAIWRRNHFPKSSTTKSTAFKSLDWMLVIRLVLEIAPSTSPMLSPSDRSTADFDVLGVTGLAQTTDELAKRNSPTYEWPVDSKRPIEIRLRHNKTNPNKRKPVWKIKQYGVGFGEMVLSMAMVASTSAQLLWSSMVFISL